MKNLNETSVLNFYLQEMEKGNISFINGRQSYYDSISKGIIELTDADGMNSKIKTAKELWKLLFEAAMTYIDPDKRGFDKLFKYFDEFVEFEELIFASDSFYRDHTLHSLWVYFLGEYVIRHESFNWIKNNMSMEENATKNQLKLMESHNMDDIFSGIIHIYEKIINSYDKGDSIRYIAAITHDLGYPLKKIEKINKSIKSVLPYFSINNFNDFNFSYSEIQQTFIESFIEFLSCNIVMNSEEYEEDEEFVLRVLEINKDNQIVGFKKEEIMKLNRQELIKLKKLLYLKPNIRKDLTKFWSYTKDFEEYKHGIMSAFLLVKNVKAFSNMTLRYIDNSNIGFNNIDISQIFAKQTILKAISDHTNDAYQITGINDSSQFLTFIDELEEFSRISRANQNREFVSEFCKTDIYMNEGFLQVDFIFDNVQIDNLDPERAFKGRCERFLNLFNITKLSKDLKIRLRCIGDLPYDKNIYCLEIANKYAKITINNEEKNIPQYLKSKQFYSREEYEKLI